jgi:hypothetical protein
MACEAMGRAWMNWQIARNGRWAVGRFGQRTVASSSFGLGLAEVGPDLRLGLLTCRPCPHLLQTFYHLRAFGEVGRCG